MIEGFLALYLLISVIYAVFKSVELYDKIEINEIDIILLPSLPISFLLLVLIKLTDRNIK